MVAGWCVLAGCATVAGWVVVVLSPLVADTRLNWLSPVWGLANK